MAQDREVTPTAGPLADWLAKLPRDTRILLPIDPEGNGYSMLDSVAVMMYLPDPTCTGMDLFPTPEDLEVLLAEKDSVWNEDDRAPEGAERVIVLWPS